MSLSVCGASMQWFLSGSMVPGRVWVAEAALQNAEVHERVYLESGVTSRRRFGMSAAS